MTVELLHEITPEERGDHHFYELDADQLAATVEKLAKINGRAERKGLSGSLSLEFLPVAKTQKNDMGFETEYTVYETRVTGEAPSLNGWKFTAALDWDEYAGLVVRTNPGVESIDRDALREGYCGHCNTTRRRTKMYVVVSEETGEQVQVGTSCLKDFLGWTGTVAWLDATGVSEALFDGMSAPLPDFTPETVLSVAWASIKAFGFVRTSDGCFGKSTRDTVMDVLYPTKSRKSQEFSEKMKPLAAEASGRAKEILEFLLSDDFAGTSEYVLNLKSIAAGNKVTRRNYGILVSAPQAWARHQERTLIRERANEKPSEWIGTEPDKASGVKGSRIVFTGIIETLRYIDGVYGTTTLYRVRDELTGAVVKWFASSDALGETQGVRVTFKGTVKAHEEYQGTKETVLTRCALIAADVKEPAPWTLATTAKKRAPKKPSTV